MTRIIGPLAAVLLPLGVSYGAFAMVESVTPHGAKLSKLPAPMHVERQAGSIVLEGEVFAAHAASGSYRLKIWQNSSSNSSISQGGDFHRSGRWIELAQPGVVA